MSRRHVKSDGHPIIENYVLVSHASRHRRNDVTPRAPEHNCDYRTPVVSLGVERPWLEKGKTRETMKNYFDMKTRNITDYVDEIIDKIKKEEVNKT